jgi:hypothetical protein
VPRAVSLRLLVTATAVAVALTAGVAGCVATGLEQRTTEGLTADELFMYRVAQQNGREPTFEERRTWQDNLDQQISDYLREHPEAANSLDLTKFRFLRQASVGMRREQVRILLGPALETTTDSSRMAEMARKYWPDIGDTATEAWAYPLGWNFYFAGDRLVDITQYVP